MERQDLWAAGNLYEPYVGRWSRLVAREFVSWLSVPTNKDWLDVGCGTGALTHVILDTATPHAVTGVDASAGFIEYAKRRIDNPLASFEVGDARALPIDSASFDVAVAALALNFVPEPSAAIAEMTRAVRPGGVVAAYLWDYAGKMELIRDFWDAAVALDPAAIDLDEGRRFLICAPKPLSDLFAQSGLRAVEVCSIDVPTRFRDFDDYWSPFLGGQGPAPGYAMSLSDDRRNALRDRIRSQLPIAPDGTIELIARAWAIRGRTPH
jgi:SAM-dependent methyltransferase